MQIIFTLQFLVSLPFITMILSTCSSKEEMNSIIYSSEKAEVISKLKYQINIKDNNFSSGDYFSHPLLEFSTSTSQPPLL